MQALAPAYSRRDWFICLALAAITLALYSPILGFEFNNYDDALYITENTRIHSGLTLANLKWAFTTTEAGHWHPLTWMSHLLDCQLFGLWAGGHHLTSLVLHVLNTLLLFGLLRRMTGATWRPAFVAALFAWHPMHVESVAWIADRKDVLSTFFGFLMLWSWCDWVRTRSWKYYAAALLWFTLGLMAKAMLISFPILLLLLDYWPLARLKPAELKTSLPGLVKEKLPFFAIALASSAVAFLAQKWAGAMVSGQILPLDRRAANALVSGARYLGKFIWPQDMTVLYPYPASLPAWQVIGAAALLAAISFVVLREWSRRPYLAVGWLWFLVSLLPVAGLIQAGEQSMADRYTYLPYLGLFLMLTWLAGDWFATWPRAKPAAAAAAVVALAVCASVTAVQLQYWRNSLALWTRALQVTRENTFAHCDFGTALLALGRTNDARIQFEQALAIAPGDLNSLIDYGGLLTQDGEFSNALDTLQRAVALHPQSASAHYNLALTLAETGKTNAAIDQYRAAIRIQSDHAKALTNLGLILAGQGKTSEAVSCFWQAVKASPDYPYAQNALAHALDAQNQTAEALAHYEAALRVKPDLADAQNGAGAILAERGEFDAAQTHLEAALELRPDFAEAHYNYANALARANKTPAATFHYTEALRLKPDYLEAHFNYGTLLERGRQWDAARKHFEAVLRLKPEFIDAHVNLAIALAQIGDDRNATAHYRAALRANPQIALAVRNLAWLLATASDAGSRDAAESLRLGNQAVQLAAADPQAWDALAAADAESGKFPEAITAAEKALTLVDVTKQPGLKDEISKRLSNYRNGIPYHNAPRQ